MSNSEGNSKNGGSIVFNLPLKYRNGACRYNIGREAVLCRCNPGGEVLLSPAGRSRLPVNILKVVIRSACCRRTFKCGSLNEGF